MNVDSIIKVGMADMQATSDKVAVLKTTGLGSCVGVALFDQSAGVAGLIHVMLPDSSIAKPGTFKPAKYADTAIPEMVEHLVRLGAHAGRLAAKLAGGAQMFAFGGSDTMRIGPRNVEACKVWLDKYRIPLCGEDTGANYGRTIEFVNATGLLIIRSVQQGVKQI